ncbi:MAG TPA: quinone-dependent dihydroorotate dehydrogenase [Longimicrobiaceae bacterium]|nr:quinone-dependent dihydroorotate dehydrogenase [Longimicrobiaceae bacterium]
MNYYTILRNALFTLPPEAAHEAATTALGVAAASEGARRLLRGLHSVDDPALAVSRWGIDFPNPVGVAAGFDKAGTLFNPLSALGFGFVEIGTITASAQPGNPRPRLFRLPTDEALLNRMGFNNPGAEAVARSLAGSKVEPVLGINLGKSKVTPIEDATDDYLRSLELLEVYGDYIVVNVSSPNTPGLRSLQDARPLRELLRSLGKRATELAVARGGTARPLLLKIAPDLTDQQIGEAVDIACEEGVAGIIAVNTTISRAGLLTDSAEVDAMGAGGISGAPIRQRAQEVVGRIYHRTAGELPIIGVGGIRSAADAWDRILAGASLIQLYTGFIYGGPGIAHEINRGLSERMAREGVGSLDEIVGSAPRTSI